MIYERILLVGIIALLQWHGAWFWYDSAGPTGALWSILLEGAAVWLWHQRITALAALCSLLIILGPLYHIGEPVILKLEQGKANDKLVKSYELELELDAKAARGTTGNITRLRSVDKARAEAKQTLDEYRASIAVAQPPGWLEYARLGVQALGLVFLQWAQILIIRRWRNPVKVIIQAVAAGRFNDKPGLAAIQDELKVSRAQVKRAFRWLVENGYMVVNDKKISLVKQGQLAYNEINLS